VVCVLSLSLAYPLREYLSQRHDIAALEAAVAKQQSDLAAGRAAYARWRDPAYVRAQAKARLHMVDPGERQYIVVQSNGTTALKPAATPAASPAPTLGSTRSARPNQAWYGALLNSVHEADRQGSTQGSR
jgi:hypothetical protein